MPDGDPKDPVPYDRFQEVIGQKNKVEAELRSLAAQHAAATAEHQKVMAEREALATTLKAEQEKAVASMREISDKLAAAEQDRLRLRVAVGAGLPIDLADRLHGATLEELQADAAKIAPLLKPTTPGVPPPLTGGTPQGKLDVRKMSPDEIRKNQARILEQAQKAG